MTAKPNDARSANNGEAIQTKMRKYSTIILLLLLSPAFAADLFDFEKEYDSLALVLPSSSGTDRVDILFEMANMLAPWEPQQSQPLADEAFALANKLNYQIGIGKAWQIKAEIAYYTDDYIKAMDYYNRAVSIFKKNSDTRNLAKCLSKISTIYLNTGNTEKCWGNIPEIIALFEKGQHLKDLSMTYYAMGFYHNNYTRDAKASIAILKKALSLAIEEKMNSRSIGSVLISLGYAYAIEGKQDSAKIFLYQGLSCFNDSLIPDRALKTEALYDIGLMLDRYMKSDSALYYFDLGLKRAGDMSFIYGKYRAHMFKADYYYRKNEIQKAIENYEFAVENALKVNASGLGFEDETYRKAPLNFWDVYMRTMTPSMLMIDAKECLARSYKMLSQLMESTGNTRKGLGYYKLYHSFTDTLNEIASDKQLLGLEIAYESDRKSQQIGMLEQQAELQEFRIRQNSILLWGLIALIVLLILFAILFFRQNRIKANQQNIQLRQRLFRSQMNPHFIFNSLASIQNSIINEDPMKASKYLARFSKLVRNILDSSTAETITLENEINTIENYLTLQKIRYPEMINFKVSVDDGLDVEATLIPPMLAQPFIENAIEHGLKSKETAGMIEVRFLLQNQNLVLEIEDNGIGRRQAQENLKAKDPGHKSMATAITLERINVINRKKKRKISLDIIDLKDESGEASGTKVVIEIPFEVV
jgi:tetratricopeptide (TPR) repeat protein